MCARARRDLAAALAAAALLAPGSRARAESAPRIDPPASFGVISAATYDDPREQVGAAQIANRSTPAPMIEVRHGPHLGPVLALLASRCLPKLSFWFDAAEPHCWMAHHVPLYSDGPEVTVIRDGISPRWVADE